MLDIIFNETLIIHGGDAMDWLRQKRKSFGKTQVDIAQSANITGSYYSMIECGRRRPSPDIAKRIAAVLGFPAEWYKLLDDKKTTGNSVV